MYNAGLELFVALAVLTGTGCVAGGRAAELYPEVAEHSGKQIERVEFIGNEPISRDSLLTLIETQPSRCSLLGLPFCVPFTRVGRQIHRLSVQRVAQDVVRLTTFYRYSGYFGTAVEPEVTENGEKVRVTFNIARGDEMRLDSLIVAGTDTILNADSLARHLPLQPGDVFHLGRFGASADTILRALQAKGYADAQVLRDYSTDTLRDRAQAALNAIPGPRVVVDSIEINGVEKLDRRAVLRQMGIREGDLLRVSRLIESQRNIYNLEIVQLASVTVAPDSLDATPNDSTRATVLVNVAETEQRQADAAVGFGTVECMRTEGQYVDRNFTGGGRRLTVTGSISKIGLGGATGIGVGESICRAFEQDSLFKNDLDYRLSADFIQPYFLSPLNQVALNVFVERLSEPKVYQRQAEGGRVLLTRRVGQRAIVTGGFDLEHGSTVATPALFCAAFEVCDPNTIESLSQPRWRNSVAASYVRDRTDYTLDPTEGSVLRTSMNWAPPWLLSDVTFLRWTGDAALYREVKKGWVAAGSIRLGNFFKTAALSPTGDFLPPEERFYAGGANTVRGFTRNALGDGVWVVEEVTVDSVTGDIDPDDDTPRFVPLGGTAMGIVNAELRMPSPFMPQRLRLAFFVDAGAIGTGNLWSMDTGRWRFTPGAGIRIATPVGPARVDFAYNPYGDDTGPLYHSTEGGTLVRIRDEYRPDSGGFFSKFRIHVAVGQAF